jgi:hypothetical protein
MSENRSSYIKSAMNGGLVTSAIFILSNFLLIYFRLSAFLQILFYLLVLGLTIFHITRKFRDKELAGNISYEKALGFGTLVSLFFSIVLAFIAYLVLKFSKRSVIDAQIDMIRIQYKEMHMSDYQINYIMSIIKSILSPGIFAFLMILFFSFFGFTAALFSSIFVKKVVSATMKNIE